ncbi:MAG: serine hydrolase [Chitinophagaceae bacterium]|nr:serine hydrolase [Chitinophagaceae bacterium]
MGLTYISKNCNPVILAALLVFVIGENSVFAQTINAATNGYGKAQYNSSQVGKFMKTWLVAGPFSVSADSIDPDGALQEKVFKTDIISTVNVIPGKPVVPVSVKQKEFKWQLVSLGDDIVDLDSFYKRKDFVYAYALSEIQASAPTNVMLAVGSDDGIKVWHNGKLVHDNWIPRGIVKDNDLVPLKLVKGSNQVLLKVQDMQGGWGFTVRMLDGAAMTDQLNVAAGSGNLDKINLLIEGGADVNAATNNGISPVAAAKVSGRDDVVQALVKKGAKDKNVPSSEILTDNFYNSLKGKEGPGIAVLVAKDGNVLYRKGFGYADVKNKIPVTPETKFRIGSVTKQFTAAAILKLQENNLLSVNDKLSKYIPDFPRGDEVTIHHLLTHTSGIRSYTSKADFISKVTKTISPDTLVSSIKKDPYDFNPGEKMLYNNSGYFLLGYIITKVSGKPYELYLKETFFDPLKMENTGVHYAGIKLTTEAKGYTRNTNKYDEALNWDMSWAGGAGAIYSTVDDLLKWNQALYGGKVLAKNSFDAALKPAVLKNAEQPPMQYGYGLILGKYRGEDIVSHGGGLHGFITQLYYYPKEKLSVVMFSNTAEPEVNFDANKIAEAFLWDKMDKQTSYSEASVKPMNLQIFTGRYDLLGQLVITITVEDNKLFSQLSGQPKFQIFPMTENEFFWKVVDAKIKFVKDDKGEYTQAILFQNGQELNAKRLPEEKIAVIDPAILDKYIGKYKLNDNIVVTVSKENNRLFATATNQPKVEMLPLSETDFVIKEINAKIYFVKDASGRITGFKLNMNGMDSELPRVE